MPRFKNALAVVTLFAMAASQAQADGVLEPGKPAGVHKAQRSPNLLLIGGVSAVVVLGIAVATLTSGDAVCGSSCDASSVSTTS